MKRWYIQTQHRISIGLSNFIYNWDGGAWGLLFMFSLAVCIMLNADHKQGSFSQVLSDPQRRAGCDQCCGFIRPKFCVRIFTTTPPNYLKVFQAA